MARALSWTVALALFPLLVGPIQAVPDLAREQRLADQAAEAIMDGEALWLEAEGQRFFAIYLENGVADAKGAVLLLHGRGFHPDWDTVIHPLRVGLAERGWNTLSIQLPVLGKDATYFDYLTVFPDALPRIESGIAYLRGRGNARIVVLAHSCGYHMAQHWIQARGAAAVEQFDALVGIGMGATDYGQPMQEAFVLGQIGKPVLDIYGARDFPAVLRHAPERRALLEQAGNPLSRQIMVPDADHYFEDSSDTLVDLVAQWLDSLQE
jgi:pimeloyl-ACP methyl ester carboxylesterase